MLNNPLKNISESIHSFNEKVKNSDINFEDANCLCNSSNDQLLATTDCHGFDQKFVLCNSCGLIRATPRMTEDEYIKFYSSDFYRKSYGENDLIQSSLKRYNEKQGVHIFNLLSSVVKINKLTKVMEFGAGGGWNLNHFKEVNAQVIGYEYTKTLVEFGNKKGINLIQGGLEKITGEFDIIILSHVLEHMLDPIATLKKLKSHLKPNGYIYIEVPNVLNFCYGQLQNAHTYSFIPENLNYYCGTVGLMVQSFGKIENSTHMYSIYSKSETVFDAVMPTSKLLKKSISRYKTRQLLKKWLSYINLDLFIASILRKLGI